MVIIGVIALLAAGICLGWQARGIRDETREVGRD